MKARRKDQKMGRIPFTRPDIGKEETAAVTRAIGEGMVGGNGRYTKEAEALLSRMTGAEYAYLTTSATDALELAMMCLDIGPGDEVICPSFTFVSTANAIARQGARPVFCDIEPVTLNMDVKKVEALITRRTKAIVPVHYAGVSCDMDKLARIASRRKVAIVEDGAQAIGARYKKRALGSIGDIGVLSFHVTKNITCGEGGVFLTCSEKIARRAEIIREKGTNRSAFLKGQVDKYTWVDIGSSFLPSDLLAAFLVEQLKKTAAINNRRMKIWKRYVEGLRPLEEDGLILLASLPPFAVPNGHIFWFLAKDGRSRDALLAELNRRGIGATFHYIPLHDSPYGRKSLGYKRGDFPVTESVAEKLVRLPLFSALTDKEVDYIIANVTDILKRGDPWKR